MGSEWTRTVLGNVVELKRGYDLPSQDRSPGSVPIVTSSGISDYHSVAKVKGPGVVTGRYGTIGQVYYIEEDYWPHNTTLYVRDFKGNDPRFISYFLRTIQYLSYSDKAAVPGVNRNHLHQALVTLPPLPEQRAIAAVLGALDDKIELNRRMNGTLEGLARALFKSWFVDFDPVRARMEGPKVVGAGLVPAPAQAQDEEGNHKGLPLPPDIAALFPDEMEVGEDGVERPRGWRVGSFSSTIEVLGGGTPKTSVQEYWNGDIPWFSVVDAPSESDVFVIDTAKKVTKLGIQNSSAQLLPIGTVIISARGTVGKIAMVGIPMAMNQSCYGLGGKLGKSGAFTYFSTLELITILKQNAHGSVFDTITRETFERINTIVPPTNIVLEFEDRVSPLLKRIRSNLIQIRTLAALRDGLLPKLMSGEVRVGQIDTPYKEAT